jgi:hypothetical protein
MNPPAGWYVSPADDRVMREAQALADEKVLAFHAYEAASKRSQLRERVGMIVTIDRANTNRSIVKSVD